MNVVLGWWWLNSLSAVRPPTGAGSIAAGGVSIAVRLKYSAKQAHVLSCDLLQEAENAGGKVVCRARSSIDMRSYGIVITV